MKYTTYLIILLAALIYGCGKNQSNTQYIWFPDGVQMKNNENYNKANLALQQHQVQDAIIYLEQAIAEGYRHPGICLRLADHYGSQENYSKALIYSQKACDILDSDNIEVMLPAELEMFKKDNRPKLLASAYSLHAMILFELGQYDQASVYTEKASVLNPNDLRIQEVKGKLAIINGDYDAAVEIFKMFTSTAPKFYDAHFYLGKAFILSGNATDGVSSLETYITKVPPSAINVAEAKKLIEEYK